VGEADQLQVLAHGQVGIQQRAVGHERERRPRPFLRQVAAGHPHLTVAGLQQACDQPQGGRLARAVMANQGDALAGL
jgi:hypothetical protein